MYYVRYENQLRWKQTKFYSLIINNMTPRKIIIALALALTSILLTSCDQWDGSYTNESVKQYNTDGSRIVQWTKYNSWWVIIWTWEYYVAPAPKEVIHYNYDLNPSNWSNYHEEHTTIINNNNASPRPTTSSNSRTYSSQSKTTTTKSTSSYTPTSTSTKSSSTSWTYSVKSYGGWWFSKSSSSSRRK